MKTYFLIGAALFSTFCFSADIDRDGDGVIGLADCDDTNPNVNDEATEICGNGVDDDCDGVADGTDDGEGAILFFQDSDGDGFGNPSRTARACSFPPSGYVANDDDCDDTNPLIKPGIPDDNCDGVDDNCDNEVDEDSEYVDYYTDADKDGYGSGAATRSCEVVPGAVTRNDDCDDGNSRVNPSAVEICNGEDDDCDSVRDEGLLGTGEACPAESCDAVRAVTGEDLEGRFYLQGNDDSVFRAWCETDPAGDSWMRVDLELVQANDWATLVKGRGAVARWDTVDLDPAVLLEPGGCREDADSMWARVEVHVPMEFVFIRGDWTLVPYQPSSLLHRGTNNTTYPWGEPYGCLSPQGSAGVKFGNDRLQILRGGEYDDWASTTSKAWIYKVNHLDSTTAKLGPPNEIWWEIGGGQPDRHIGAYLTDVDLYVR